MVIFMVVTSAILLRFKIPPQTILSAALWTSVFSVILFFFSEFLINLIMGAERVDPEKYPRFIESMEKMKKSRGALFGLPLIFQPRMRILPMHVPNAMAYGSGILGQCCIAITPRLYHMMSQEELDAVVAHEYGHIRSLDIGMMTVVGMIAGAVERMRMLIMTQLNIGISALLAVPAVLLWLISKLAFGVLRMAISKEREFAADALSAWYVGSPDPLISALKKLEGYRDGRIERVETKRKKVKEKKETSGEKSDESEDKSVLDRVLPKSKHESMVLKDLMISHPGTDRRIRSLESLRSNASKQERNAA
jgi:heat shock protein HtpX